ncbi:GNAT family N-acetyltransferase [Sediminicurvatus halobius]|uniref:GNAT family N-acetyltransferase n=1 Tax=Sediminicurvatus halobius TaxID=2182432 RepID=UPI001E4CDE02|nr:N-acetyltransferase [Spiribacter halobius]UEX77930.1 N-acetyltransferase [Spiribacter halobius]
MSQAAQRVRPERPGDEPAIARVNEAAFGRPDEARLVAALRATASPFVSLVAEDADSALTGHIAFSPVTVGHEEGLSVMALAPMAVMPARQRSGVGTALIQHGLSACRAIGVGAVVVLGHADYYARFGFAPASRFGLRCPYDAPEEAFMAIELIAGYLEGIEGTVAFHAAFADL